MTRQEILSLEHLAIAEETKFVHLHTEDGYFITGWMEGDDILLYSGGVCYYMPIRDDYRDLRVITKEEHEELVKLRTQKHKEIEEQEKLKRANVDE